MALLKGYVLHGTPLALLIVSFCGQSSFAQRLELPTQVDLLKET